MFRLILLTAIMVCGCDAPLRSERLQTEAAAPTKFEPYYSVTHWYGAYGMVVYRTNEVRYPLNTDSVEFTAGDQLTRLSGTWRVSYVTK